MAVKRKNEAGAPAFSGALDSKAGYIGLLKKGMILLVVWLGVLLDKDQRYTFSEVDALIDNFMKGKVN
mgnify:CR=1 FL=1